MTDGWIKVHRQLLNHKIWLSEKFTDGQAWIDLLLLANHQESIIHKHGVRLTVPRGYVGWAEISLATRWKWSRGKVRRFFSFLIQQKMIEIEQQNNRLTTLIKIVNYESYQETVQQESEANGQQTVQQTDNRRYRNKNDKNEKNKPYSEDFLKFWSAYPKRTGSKKNAWIWWEKTNGDRPPLDVILSSIRDQIEWRKSARPGEFRPEWKDAERWIKGKCWEIETDVPLFRSNVW